jgi:flagellar motor switch protein FliM
MLEPIRELLDAGVLSDHVEMDERWSQALKEEIMDATLDLTSVLAETELTLRQVKELDVGDIISIEMPELISIKAAGVPVFRCKHGVANGNKALKVVEPIANPGSHKAHEQ